MCCVFQGRGDAIRSMYRVVRKAARDRDEVVQMHAAICKQVIDDSLLQVLADQDWRVQRLVL